MFTVLISAVLTTPVGYLADRINKRFLITLGGFTTVLSMLLFAYARRAWDLYVASIVAGLGGAVSVPAMMAMAVIIGRAEKSMGSIISFLTMAHSLGMMTGPILAGIMIDLFDMRMTFLCVSVFMAMITMIFLPLTAQYEFIETRAQGSCNLTKGHED